MAKAETETKANKVAEGNAEVKAVAKAEEEKINPRTLKFFACPKTYARVCAATSVSRL